MKRTLPVILSAAFLALPAIALASRVATGATRTAIERAAGNGYTGIPQRCLLVEITTKDAGRWATVGFNGARAQTCAKWGFNGVSIMHRRLGRWHYVTAGSAGIPCGRFHIPVAVRQDLHLPCR